MQITSGLISCDPLVDPSLVEGNASVDWTQVTVGCLLVVNGISYSITNVNPTLKTLRISPNWVGEGVSGVAYVIVRDFTMMLQLPLLNPGDLEAAAIFSRAMKILDGLTPVLSETPNVSDYPIVQSAHGFRIGNVLRISGSAWVLANSSSSTAAMAVGVVTRVVDNNTFWLRTSGPVGTAELPIYGLTLNPGQIYYLRETPIAAGSYYVNLCEGADIDTGPMKVPVLQAITVNTAMILGLAQTATQTFAPGRAGLVPDPTAATGKILSDGGWTDFEGVPDDSIRARHLDPTVPWMTTYAAELDWDNFQNQASNTPVHAFIMDLQLRLKVLEAQIADGAYTQTIFTRKSHPTGAWTWTVPAGVKWCQVTLLTGELRTYQASLPNVRGSQPQVSDYFGRGIIFRLGLEGVSSLSGDIGAYKNVLRYNSIFTAVEIGKDITGASGLSPWQRLPDTIPDNPTINLTYNPNTSSYDPLTLPVNFEITPVRPVSSPHIFYTGFRTFDSKLVSYHFPGRTTVPDGTPSDSGGYYYYTTHVGPKNGWFAGAVVIETGLRV